MKRTFLLLFWLAVVALAQRPTVMITAEPAHHLTIDNEYVRVYKVEAAPRQATQLHFHGHDYLFVTLGDSHVSNEVEGKQPMELTLSDGDTRFVRGNFSHVARNLSDQPFRNITIELMRDEKMRNAPSAWTDKEGDVKDSRGVHVKVVAVRDGARVSEIELQPGATIPSHHHDGPHLMVAVSDLHIRSDIEGAGPMPGKFKSGDVKWLRGGYTHTLTNTGSAVAKLVTVEFK